MNTQFWIMLIIAVAIGSFIEEFFRRNLERALFRWQLKKSKLTATDTPVYPHIKSTKLELVNSLEGLHEVTLPSCNADKLLVGILTHAGGKLKPFKYFIFIVCTAELYEETAEEYFNSNYVRSLEPTITYDSAADAYKAALATFPTITVHEIPLT